MLTELWRSLRPQAAQPANIQPLSCCTAMENPYASPAPIEYDPGRVSWGQFLLAAGATLLFAGLLAVALAALFQAGLYFAFWAPLLAALLLSGLLFWSVRISHCRSRSLAALIGILATLTLYLGQYHADMVMRVGAGAAHRLDLLPRYIAWRKSVEKHDRGRNPRDANAAPDKHEIVTNWVFFSLELSMVSFAVVGAGLAASGRPYCNHCRKWMRRDADFLPAGIAPALVQAVERDRLGDLLDLPSNAPGARRRYTVVTVSWCPPVAGRPSLCPAFLSVKSVKYGGGVGQLNQIDLAIGRTSLRMHPLTEQQIAELRPRFPEMSKAAVGVKRPSA